MTRGLWGVAHVRAFLFDRSQTGNSDPFTIGPAGSVPGAEETTFGT